MGHKVIASSLVLCGLSPLPVLADIQWKWLGAGRRAGTLPWNDDRIPDELAFAGDGESGRIRGTAKIDAQLSLVTDESHAG